MTPTDPQTGTAGSQPAVPVSRADAATVTRNPTLSLTCALVGALAGFTLAALLTLRHATGDFSGLCTAAGGCQHILSSRYARVGPVPTASLGLAFYLLTLLAWSLAIARPTGPLRRLAVVTLVATSTVAAAISLVLMFLQFAILRGFCPLCTLSAIFCCTLCLLAWRLRRRTWTPQPIALATLAVPPLIAISLLGSRPPAAPTADLVAEVAGQRITSDQMPPDLRDTLGTLEWDAHRAKVDWATRRAILLMLERESASQGVPPDQVLSRAVDARTRDAERAVDDYLRTNPPPPGRDPATARDQILAQLRDDAAKQFVEDLKQKFAFKLHLRPPTPRESDLDPDQLGHRLGPPDAPARLVVFSDFQCPACAALAQSLHAARERFGDRLSITYLHLPLPTHPLARDAAAVAECAADRGRFWPFHDALMSHNGQLDDAALAAAAQSAGIDRATLDACRADDSLRARVDRHASHAAAIGLDATPALFLNGQHIGGNPPAADLTRLIESTLPTKPAP